MNITLQKSMRVHIFLRSICGIFLFLACLPSSSAARLFSDVPPDNQYFEAISALEQRGIINGFSDGTFRPNHPVVRAAALKIVLLSAGVELSGVATKDPFPDVPRHEWFAPIAKKGRDIGIVKGDGNGYFLPSKNVSRSEALAMLFRTNGDSLKDPIKKPFSDVPLTAWYAKYFSAAKNSGLLQSNPVQPDHLLTRGELSDLTYRFFRGDWNSSETRGKASYYGNQFEGRTTANGEKFSNAEFTAAHRTLPFGTRVRVTNADTLQSIVVRINDRGPFADGRIIDLSSAAFQALAPLSRGVIPVSLQVVPESTPLGYAQECAIPEVKKSIAIDAYDNVILDQPLPDTFRKNEVYVVSGKVVGDSIPEIVSIFYGTEDGKRLFRGETKGDTFSIPVSFPEEGKFLFSVLAGQSGHSNAETVHVKSLECEPNTDMVTSPPTDLFAQVQDGDTVFSWTDSVNNLFRLEFTQEGKTVEFFVFDKKKFFPPPTAFEYFSEGLASVKIWGSQAEGDAFHRRSSWKGGEDQKIFISKRVSRHDNLISNVSLSDQFSLGESFAFSGTTERPLDRKALIVDPNENIIEVEMTVSGNSFSGKFKPTLLGTHIVEINQSDGITLFVGASVPKGTLPLLPDFFDIDTEFRDNPDKIIPDNKISETLLRLVNRERRIRQLSLLKEDPSLTNLAQFRADDMCERKYFSHIDPDGKGAKDYRVLYNVQTYVAENIVKDMSVERSHERLMRSPAHRASIIDPGHSRVGFGYCRPDDEPDILVITEIFGGDTFSSDSVPQWREQILQDINSVRGEDAIVPNATIESVAQQWAARMAKKNFWSFQDGDDSLESSLRDAGIKNYARGIVLKLGSISDLEGEFVKKSISLGGEVQDNFLLDTSFKKMGIGIAQNDVWEIFIVILAIQ